MLLRLESLVVPKADATKEAGELIINLPRLWKQADLRKRRRIILSMLDVVYIDAKKYKTMVAIKPKPPYIPIFQAAVSKKESDIRIINEPLKTAPKVPSVFLVETGETQNTSETRCFGMHYSEMLIKTALNFNYYLVRAD